MISLNSNVKILFLCTTLCSLVPLHIYNEWTIQPLPGNCAGLKFTVMQKLTTRHVVILGGNHTVC